MAGATRKRKHTELGPRKRVKASELQWKRTKLPTSFGGFDDEGGILELDEIDGVDVVKGEDGIYQFVVRDEEGETKTQGNKAVSGTATKAAAAASETAEKEPPADAIEVAPAAAVDAAPVSAANGDSSIYEDLPLWKDYNLPVSLLKGLKELGFTEPTAIQTEVLKNMFVEEEDEEEEWGGIPEPGSAVTESEREKKSSSQRHDIIGISQTGSGKTLAYALPILSHLITSGRVAERRTSDAPHAKSRNSGLASLILAPTRELAIQVKKAISDLVAATPHYIKVITITGGLSIEKQQRQLRQGADIVIATPGRLAEIISVDDALYGQLQRLEFLVLDEADRMVQHGHFQELDDILKLTRRKGEDEEEDDWVEAPPGSDDEGGASDVSHQEKARGDDEGESDGLGESDSETFPSDTSSNTPRLTTYVFSATMSKALQSNLKRGTDRRRMLRALRAEDNDDDALGQLLATLDLRDSAPVVINLAPELGVAASVTESLIECIPAEKDLYLYYFLLRYPGRTLVFLNSVDGIRRLHPLLQLLMEGGGAKGGDAMKNGHAPTPRVLTIHSNLQQKQRLQAVERFAANPHSVMLATDVAARGLDIRGIDHIIHYHLPRSADTYIHRSGRTGRANAEGVALILLAPAEKQALAAITRALGRSVKDLPHFSVEYSLLDQLKERIQVAERVEKLLHRLTKENHDAKWLRDAADALGIDQSDTESEGEGESVLSATKRKNKRLQAQIKEGKAHLRSLLAQPVMIKGASAKYLTGTARSKEFVSRLLKGSNGVLLGAGESGALEDLKK